MSEITDKAYDRLLSTLKQLSDEADIVKLATKVDKKEFIKIKQELELLRGEYLHHEKQARKAYTEFEMKFNTVCHQLSEIGIKTNSRDERKTGYVPL